MVMAYGLQAMGCGRCGLVEGTVASARTHTHTHTCTRAMQRAAHTPHHTHTHLCTLPHTRTHKTHDTHAAPRRAAPRRTAPPHTTRHGRGGAHTTHDTSTSNVPSARRLPPTRHLAPGADNHTETPSLPCLSNLPPPAKANWQPEVQGGSRLRTPMCHEKRGKRRHTIYSPFMLDAYACVKCCVCLYSLTGSGGVVEDIQLRESAAVDDR